MNDEIKKLLDDVLLCINKIERFIGDERLLETYKGNDMLKSSVERNLEIIGEAINNVLKINAEIQITNARKFVNVRNKLIHGYDEVDDVTIWAIIINHLPLLKTEVQKLLED